MNKILNLGLLLFCKYLLITSATYIGDVSQVLQESAGNQNLVKSPYYLISTPKVWMSAEESVCLVLLREFSLPNAVIDVKIQSFNSRETFVQRYQPLQSSSQCIQIPINEVRAERALLRVQVSDVIDESLEIRIKPSYGLTLIETSKPIYRANEKLQFRIITLNDWLRPIEEQFQQISVQNSKSIPVMQWNSINATNGLISLEVPIAEDNVLGTWKIRVVTKNNVVTEKIFRVQDYETPNVDITVESPNYIFSSDEQTVSKICVRNSFGHPLKGKLNSFVSYFRFNWERLNQLSHVTLPYYSNEVEINGCYDLVLQSSKLHWNSTKYSQRNLKLNLQFIDSANGVIEDKSFDIPVVENQLIISFPSVKLVKQYFKPGLPYFGYVLVSRPDYSFAPEEQMTICYQSRELPWTTGPDYNCQQIVSNNDGLVHFTIPPQSNKFKQIEVRVQSLKYPNIQRKIVLQPTFSPSDEYMAIRPLISRSHCYNDFVEFDVLFNRPLDIESRKFYYQIIGRGLFQAPQQYALQPLQRWADQSLITTGFNISVTKLRVKIPQQSALNNNIINRILLYYLDANNNLIADSNVFLTTCSDHSVHSTQINLNNGYNQNSLNLQLRTHQNSKCAVRVSQNKPYSSLKKINQFIEKFNVYQESSAFDRCQKIYNNRNHESETLYSPYTAPYGLQEVNTNYQPVINYGDAWDSFNDIGLLVSSNTKLDESPCDWDLYPTDILSQLRDRRNDQIQYFNRNANRYTRNQLQEVEKSLFNEILDWNVVNYNNGPIHQQIDHNLVSTSQRLYSDAVCVNPQFGIFYARNSYTNNVKENSFRLSVRAPTVSRLGETIVFKVFVEKSRQQCLPIQLQFGSSAVYEVVNQPKLVCICGNSSEPISLVLKPKQIGSFDVKIVATNPINLSGDDISPDCAQSLSIPFAPQTAIRQLTVNPIGIVSKQVNHHVICNNNDNNIEQQTSVFNLPHLRHNSQVVVTNDLLEPMLRYVKWKVSSGNHNALDSLSAFAASYYLYSYSNNNSNEWDHKNDLIHELSKSYQSLMTYRHNDGSYSLIKSRNSLGDIGLSTSVFRVLAQSKPYLSYVESGNRVNRLHNTLLWIYGQQSNDGCFYGTVNNKLNVWPFNFENQYELTGYVLASLLEAGLDYGSNPLVKAYQCLSNNTNLFLSQIKTHPLSAVFYTYIQILSGYTEGSRVWIQALQPLNNLDEKDLLNREVLSYLGLSYYLTNDLSSAKQYGQRLLQSSNLWQTPISSYAITKLWPVLRSQRSSLTVYGENNETPQTLLLNETHSQHSLVGNRIQTNQNGCLLISNNQIKTNLVTNSNNFKVTIDGLDKGFVTCNRRRVTLCVKENVHYSAVHPVVRVQLVTGFDVDKQLMKKLIDNESVVKYKNLNGEVLVFLHSFHNNKESYCVTIPLVQKEELYNTSEAYIRVYDYYNEDLNDVIPYRIPLQCQIVQNFNQQNFNQQNFNQQNFNQQTFNQHNFNQQYFNQQNFNQHNFNQQTFNQQNFIPVNQVNQN